MAIPIILDKRIEPGEKVKFSVRIELGDNILESSVLEFTAPVAMDSMKRIEDENFTATLTKEAGGTNDNNNSWQISEWRRFAFEQGNKKEPALRIKLVQTNNYEGLQLKKPVKFVTSTSGDLKILNGKQKNVIEVGPPDRTKTQLVLVKLTVAEWNSMPGKKWNNQNPKSDPLPFTVLSTSPRRIEGVKSKQKKHVIRLSLNSNLSQSLINQETVRDIIVYAFSQFDPKSKKVPPRYYIERKSDGTVKTDTDLEVKNSPLSYNKAVELFLNNNKQKFSYASLKFDPKEGSRVVFFATVIRYVRGRGGVWKAMDQVDITSDNDGPTKLPRGWLQLNESNKPIWARALGVK